MTPTMWEELVRTNGVAETRSLISMMTMGEMREQLLTRVYEARERHELRMASTPQIARERFLAWASA